LQNLKVSFPAHPCRPKQVLDNEYWNLMVGGNHKWARYTSLGVNKMVSTLTVESESLFLENGSQHRVMDGPKSRH
jgi:hypothetical protein